MWGKHKSELIGCVAVAFGIVLAMLLLVSIFEYFGIHVPGSREMWIGLIGAVIGGIFTLFGVLITIYKQEEIDDEKRRLEYMPILGFKSCYNAYAADMILAYEQGKSILSSSNDPESKQFMTIEVQPINNNCAFNFGIEECAINFKSVSIERFFTSTKKRIAIREKASFSFDYPNIASAPCFLVRFSYEDIWGNKYFQDLPFILEELNIAGNRSEDMQMIRIRDIKQPILFNKRVGTLAETFNCYKDYDRFKGE